MKELIDIIFQVAGTSLDLEKHCCDVGVELKYKFPEKVLRELEDNIQINGQFTIITNLKTLGEVKLQRKNLTIVIRSK